MLSGLLLLSGLVIPVGLCKYVKFDALFWLRVELIQEVTHLQIELEVVQKGLPVLLKALVVHQSLEDHALAEEEGPAFGDSL